jgi:hypothetical protein
MFDRPALQSQQLQETSQPVRIYANWDDNNLCVAFRVPGTQGNDRQAVRNFVNYQLRRAWGEDLCEVLIQPIYADNTTGPVLTVSCKPTATWVDRKLDERTYADPWIPLEGAAVRYAATVDETKVWRGELAIPWKAIGDPTRGRPVLLRFNFSQHQNSTGESGSWAGPIDFGRDDTFTGLLHVLDSSKMREMDQGNGRNE